MASSGPELDLELSPVRRTRLRCQRGSTLLCATAVTTVSLSSAMFSGTATG
jgi:hypothetical protein